MQGGVPILGDVETFQSGVSTGAYSSKVFPQIAANYKDREICDIGYSIKFSFFLQHFHVPTSLRNASEARTLLLLTALVWKVFAYMVHIIFDCFWSHMRSANPFVSVDRLQEDTHLGADEKAREDMASENTPMLANYSLDSCVFAQRVLHLLADNLFKQLRLGCLLTMVYVCICRSWPPIYHSTSHSNPSLSIDIAVLQSSTRLRSLSRSRAGHSSV
jgi:hypothetical protein